MTNRWRLLFAMSFLSAISCHENTTELRHVSYLELTAENVRVSDAWIGVRFTQQVPHNSIILTRNDSVIYNFYYRGVDTVLYDHRLQMKHPYVYKAYLFNDFALKDSSSTLAIVTMDTTSHNLTWSITTLGNTLGLGLQDVAIVNDTCIWAVGEIYNYDSAGQSDPTLYNAAVWNGSEWRLRRITVSFRGHLITPPLQGIFAFSASQIWLMGSLPIFGDGSSWTMYDLRTTLDPNVSISKGWGLNPQDMYFVGLGGTIVRNSASVWQKLESGTALDIRDIWGATNRKTGKVEIMAVASKEYESDDRTILKISGDTVTTLSDNGISTPLMGVWFMPGRTYYVAGADVFSKRNPLDNSWWWPEDLESWLSTYYRNAIRGNDLNDIFTAGDYGEILHYNGKSWQSYYQATQLSGLYHSVAVRGNLVVAVGVSNQLGVIAMGRR